MGTLERRGKNFSFIFFFSFQEYITQEARKLKAGFLCIATDMEKRAKKVRKTQHKIIQKTIGRF